MVLLYIFIVSSIILGGLIIINAIFRILVALAKGTINACSYTRFCLKSAADSDSSRIKTCIVLRKFPAVWWNFCIGNDFYEATNEAGKTWKEPYP